MLDKLKKAITNLVTPSNILFLGSLVVVGYPYVMNMLHESVNFIQTHIY